MNLIQQFNHYVKLHHLFDKNDRILLAVSGGVDSVVLCELFKQNGFDFAIAHCNFQLRGEESDADELFVKSFGEKYNVEVFVKRFDTLRYAKEQNVNIQIAARELRYQWFNELLKQVASKKIKSIATAHHLNDNIETLLMNFFKGTGIRGLQGMLPGESGIGGKVIRPLLFASKEMLISFAKENQMQWREDSSNETVKYTRNFLRNEIIPRLKNIYPEIEKNLEANLERFNEIASLYNESVEKFKSKFVVIERNEIRIPVLKLLQSNSTQTLLYEILNPFGFSAKQIPEVRKLLIAESGKHVVSSTHRIFRNRNWLIVSPISTKDSSFAFIDADCDNVSFDGYCIEMKTIPRPDKIDADSKVALLDPSLLKFPLLIRKWKQGDYFYPLGMTKKKKLSRFFIDQKMSLTEKENCLVIESDKRIVWIIGHRIDNRFKITDNTKNVIRLTLSSSK